MTYPLQSIKQTLNSVEAVSGAIAATPWSVDFRQLDRGAKPATVDALASANAVLLRIDMNNRVHQLAAPAANMIHFGLPAKPQPEMRFGRRLLGSETLMSIDPDVGVNAVSAPEFGLYTLSVRTSRVEEMLEAVGVHAVSAGRLPTIGQRSLSTSIAAGLRHAAALVLDAVDTTANDLALVQALESDLVMAFADGFSRGDDVPYIRRGNRSRALKRALSYIHEECREAISIEALCRETGTSLSTLQRAFHEHFGLSPKQYVTAVRLSGVRQLLLNPQETRTISDLASAWGFWHMSKFTADYKRHFGECPSTTRRSS